MCSISNHAKERYAERVMNKEERLDMLTFIAQNKDKIENDIQKMIEFGTVVYEGESISFGDAGKLKNIRVMVNGTWVIIIDIKRDKVITLYSVDLGLGKDFNKEYINKLLEVINTEKEQHLEQVSKAEALIKEFEETKEDCITTKSDYLQRIKSVDEIIAGLDSNISAIKADLLISEKRVTDVVAVLIGKKVF